MELMELAEKLVGFDTVTRESSTMQIADFISNYLEGAGFKIERYPYVNETEGLKKINVIARKGEGKTKLALSGHMDTMGHKGNWNDALSAPLELNFRKTNDAPNGAYFARGIADMKLFLAIAMKAGEATDAKELKQPFALYFTSDEEVGCLGARRLIKDAKQLADYIIIGEPTELVPVYAHKGYIYPYIELLGKTAHSSNPDNGVSVVPALMEVLKKVSDFEERLKTINDEMFSPPYPTLNLGVITTNGKYDLGGKMENVISSKNNLAGFCQLELEIRTVPDQDAEEIERIFKDLIGSKFGKVKIRFKKKRKPSPSMKTPIDSPLVRIAQEITGKTPITAPYNTEGGVFNKIGAHTIVLGPGRIKQAHTKEEFVEPKFFQPEIVDLYTRIIRRLCC